MYLCYDLLQVSHCLRYTSADGCNSVSFLKIHGTISWVNDYPTQRPVQLIIQTKKYPIREWWLHTVYTSNPFNFTGACEWI